MTADEQAEHELLGMANEQGKFAVALGHSMDKRLQAALERLQIRRWVTLIDLSNIAEMPGPVFRIFLATPEAMTWFRKSN